MIKEYEFRNYSKDYLQNRQDQYSYVASEVKKSNMSMRISRC